MAARHLRKPRFPIACHGHFGRVQPVFRMPVVQGETMRSLRYRMRLQSQPVTAALGGAYVNLDFTYVPLRLIDPNYAANIAMGTYVPPANLNGTFARAWFGGPAGVSALFAKAFERSYNYLYRDYDVDGYYALDVSADFPKSPIWDLTGEGLRYPIGKMGDVVVPITDDATPEGSLSMRALHEGVRDYAAMKAIDTLDGTYSTYLSASGVDTQDSLIARDPEHLKRVRRWIEPSRSLDDATGKTVQAFMTEIDVDLGARRFFPEAGFVIGLMGVSPKFLFSGKKGCIDDALPSVWQDAFQPDPFARDPVKDLSGAAWVSAGAGTFDTRSVLFSGEHLNGLPDAAFEGLVAQKDPASIEDTRFVGDVPGYTTPVADYMGGAMWQIDALATAEILTPVSKPAVY